jgi:serine/threonine protein kinase
VIHTSRNTFLTAIHTPVCENKFPPHKHIPSYNSSYCAGRALLEGLRGKEASLNANCYDLQDPQGLTALLAANQGISFDGQLQQLRSSGSKLAVEAADLLARCFEPNPELRLTPAQALEMPFLAGTVPQVAAAAAAAQPALEARNDAVLQLLSSLEGGEASLAYQHNVFGACCHCCHCCPSNSSSSSNESESSNLAPSTPTVQSLRNSCSFTSSSSSATSACNAGSSSGAACSEPLPELAAAGKKAKKPKILQKAAKLLKRLIGSKSSSSRSSSSSSSRGGVVDAESATAYVPGMCGLFSWKRASGAA